eukprot:TRINITY_DN3150_c0_g2_i1.p1 TRINITY_DN3150_c0_g2~~TRINITY_DN3150_c0_g2_i1.p1  ORF type:complete len:910 (-),score=179.07 TRINITY_DN3150_c0_g2_i1:134-2533(-)
MAAAYIQRVLVDLQKNTHKQTEMEILVQSATGSYFLNYRGFKGFINVYTNITNIIVRIHRKGSDASDALLLSCHYDSMTGTEGASDNGAAVSVMLETIRALVTSPPPVNEYVILFNGAEEMGLQGAHGFVEHHPVAKKLRAFINLDSGGCGGRTTLLQTGPGHGWLTEVYNSVAPRRMGSVASQDIFQSGVVPSDTDFRIFAEFGNIPGLDFVYFKDGFAYHTHLDTIERIPPGSLQFSGDNILAIARHLGNDPQLGEKSRQPAGHSAVYYDILGIVGIVYSWPTAQVVNYASSVIGIFVCIYVISKGRSQSSASIHGGSSAPSRIPVLLGALGTTIANLIIGISFSVLTAVLVSVVLGRQMTFYSTPWTSVVLYGAPALIGMLFVQMLFTTDSISSFTTGSLMQPSEYPGVILYMGTLLFFSLKGILFTSMGLGLSYMPMLWSFYLSFAVLFLASRESKAGQDKPIHEFDPSVEFPLLLGLGFIPSILTFDMFESFYGFIVPITGRAGPIPADIVVAVVFGLMTVLNLLPFAPLLHRVLIFTITTDARAALRKTVLMLSAITLAMSVILTLHAPFSASHPKRLLVQETLHIGNTAASTMESSPSHIYVIGVDNLPPPTIDLAGTALSNLQLFEASHSPKEELQAVYPLALEIVSSGWRVSSPASLLTRTRIHKTSDVVDSNAKNRRVRLTLRKENEQGLCTSRYHTLNITSPLTWWSLTEEPPRTPSEDMLDIYFIRRVSGSDDDWSFEVELPHEAPLRVSFTATYFCSTDAVNTVASRFPDWVTLTTWTSVMESYTF